MATTDLPNKEQVIIDDLKLTEYLLNPDHEDGASKADFFSRFGFSRKEPESLSQALRQHAEDRQVTKTKDNEYGTKYELQCEMITPDDRNPCIVTVWIIDNGADNPRLVTAYPA